MGKPVTKKKNSAGEHNGIRYGLSSMQGWRPTMEDAHRVSLTLPGELQEYAFAGVFDGHAGAKTSAYTSRHLLKRILENISIQRSNKDPTAARSSPTTGNSNSLENSDCIKRAILESFLKLDDTIRKRIHDNSGTTAVCVLVSPTHYYFANCGDSRAFLCSEDKIRFATKDHKPSSKAEKKRIKAAGGEVKEDRVNGCLALSRALGDFDFKSNANKGQCEQMVIPEPEVTVIERKTETDQFIVLACDGVFDVISNHELASYITTQMRKTKDIKIICKEVVDHCFKKGSRDNISVVLLELPGCPTQEDLLQKRKLTFAQMHHVVRSKMAKTEAATIRKTDAVQHNKKDGIGKNRLIMPNAFLLYFLDYFRKHGGNICQAAKVCGQNWRQLGRAVQRKYKRQYVNALNKNRNQTARG